MLLKIIIIYATVTLCSSVHPEKQPHGNELDDEKLPEAPPPVPAINVEQHYAFLNLAYLEYLSCKKTLIRLLGGEGVNLSKFKEECPWMSPESGKLHQEAKQETNRKEDVTFWISQLNTIIEGEAGYEKFVRKFSKIQNANMTLENDKRRVGKLKNNCVKLIESLEEKIEQIMLAQQKKPSAILKQFEELFKFLADILDNGDNSLDTKINFIPLKTIFANILNARHEMKLKGKFHVTEPMHPSFMHIFNKFVGDLKPEEREYAWTKTDNISHDYVLASSEDQSKDQQESKERHGGYGIAGRLWNFAPESVKKPAGSVATKLAGAAANIVISKRFWGQ